MSGRRPANLIVLLLATATVASVATLYLRPHAPDVPSPWYRGPTEAERAMERPVGAVDLRGLTFEEGMIRLENTWNVPIDVDWPAVKNAGWSRKDPLRFRGRDVSLEEALRYTLAGENGKPSLGFAPRGGRIVVLAGPAPTWNGVSMRAYDMKDLLNQQSILDWPMTPPFDAPARSPRQQAIGRQERIERLTQLVEDTIDPDTWRDNGGAVGSIRYVGTVLVVNQTATNQASLRTLLRQLRSGSLPWASDEPEELPTVSARVLRIWDDRVKHFVAPDGSEVERALRVRRPELELVDVSFADALDRLAELWSVPIYQEPSVNSNQHVTVRLHDCSLRDALRIVMQLASGNSFRYTAADGVIVLYDPKVRRGVETKCYDLRSWMRELGYLDEHLLPIEKLDGPRNVFAENVMSAILRTINPDEWRDNGGPTGVIREALGRLVVTASRDSHDQIEDLLSAMRNGVKLSPGPATKPADSEHRK